MGWMLQRLRQPVVLAIVLGMSGACSSNPGTGPEACWGKCDGLNDAGAPPSAVLSRWNLGPALHGVALAGDSQGKLHVVGATQSNDSIRYLRVDEAGVEKSEDLPASLVISTRICSIDSTLFAVAATTTNIFVFRSDDSGDNWSMTADVTPAEDAPLRELELACSGNGNIAVLTRHLGRDDVRVFSSVDGGEAFIETELDLNEGRESPVYLPAGWRHCATDDNLYIGFVDYVPARGAAIGKVYASTDFGQSFAQATPVSASFSASSFELACGANGRVNFMGGFDSLLSRDSGQTWARMDTALSSLSSVTLKKAGAVGENLFVVLNRFGGRKSIFSSADGGESYDSEQIVFEDGGSGAHYFAVSGALTILAWETVNGDQRGLWFSQSEDAGLTWSAAPIQVTEALAKRHIVGVDAAGNHSFFLWLEVGDNSTEMHAARH
jgi:hypothetical protein